jgi:hypothetical protein
MRRALEESLAPIRQAELAPRAPMMCRLMGAILVSVAAVSVGIAMAPQQSSSLALSCTVQHNSSNVTAEQLSAGAFDPVKWRVFSQEQQTFASIYALLAANDTCLPVAVAGIYHRAGIAPAHTTLVLNPVIRRHHAAKATAEGVDHCRRRNAMSQLSVSIDVSYLVPGDPVRREKRADGKEAFCFQLLEQYFDCRRGCSN